MIVTYTPTNGEPRTWAYKPAELPSADAEAAETAAGMTFDEINLGLLKGMVKARRVVLWLLLRRDNPQLRFKDVAFRIDELHCEWDPEERRDYRAALEKAPNLTDDERDLALAFLADDQGDEEGEPADPTAAPTPDQAAVVAPGPF